MDLSQAHDIDSIHMPELPRISYLSIRYVVLSMNIDSHRYFDLKVHKWIRREKPLKNEYSVHIKNWVSINQKAILMTLSIYGS